MFVDIRPNWWVVLVRLRRPNLEFQCHGIENSQSRALWFWIQLLRMHIFLSQSGIDSLHLRWLGWLLLFSILFITFASVLLGQQLAGDPHQTQSSINGQHHWQLAPGQVEQLSTILRTKWHRCSCGWYGMMMPNILWPVQPVKSLRIDVKCLLMSIVATQSAL